MMMMTTTIMALFSSSIGLRLGRPPYHYATMGLGAFHYSSSTRCIGLRCDCHRIFVAAVLAAPLQPFHSCPFYHFLPVTVNWCRTGSNCINVGGERTKIQINVVLYLELAAPWNLKCSHRSDTTEARTHTDRILFTEMTYNYAILYILDFCLCVCVCLCVRVCLCVPNRILNTQTSHKCVNKPGEGQCQQLKIFRTWFANWQRNVLN